MVVFCVLLFLSWALFFALGIDSPLSTLNSLLLSLVLPAAALLVLFVVWLTILISPADRGTENSARESAWRLAAAAFCLALLGLAMSLGGGPFSLGLHTGGHFGIGLQPIRDLLASPEVKALAAGREEGSLPPEKWPQSFASWDRPPRMIQVYPSPPGAPPRLWLGFGRAGHDIVVQPERPDDSDPVVERWADGIWIVRANGRD